MKPRFFFVIYLYNDSIKTILDGMRIIADPLQRNFSHITVKGPYRNNQQKLLSKDSKLIEGKEIKVLGAGNFFIDDQNTVFLKCEERQELYTIWKNKEEKTYKEFHPHITIYDGKNRAFAHELFDTINSHKINFSFIVERLELYSSADKVQLFDLRSKVNYGLLSKLSGFDITPENIDGLSYSQRILVIDKLCGILERINDILDAKTSPYANLDEHSILIEM